MVQIFCLTQKYKKCLKCIIRPKKPGSTPWKTKRVQRQRVFSTGCCPVFSVRLFGPYTNRL